MSEKQPSEETEHLIAKSPRPKGTNQYAGKRILFRNHEVVLDEDGQPLGWVEAQPGDKKYSVPRPGLKFYELTEVIDEAPEEIGSIIPVGQTEELPPGMLPDEDEDFLAA